MEKKKRMTWLDGLKGIACFGVFTHHFMLGFYSATYFGAERPSLMNGVDTFLASSPLGVIINGNFWVNIFVLISAFLPAKRIMRCQEGDLRREAGTMMLRRYPRLVLPISFVCMFNYFAILFMNAHGLNYSGKKLLHGFVGYVFHVFFYQFLAEDSTVLGPLWTIHYLFFGMLLAVLLALPDKKEHHFMPFLYGVLALLTPLANVHYTAAVFGVLLADLTEFDRLGQIRERFSIRESRRRMFVISCLMIVLGLYLGGYPSYVIPTNSYRVFLPVAAIATPIVIHAGAAFLLILGAYLWNENMFPSLLSTRPMQFLGKNCMGVFLLHILWQEYLGYYVNDLLLARVGDQVKATLILYPCLTVCLLVSANLYRVFVEEPCNKLTQRIRM